SEDDGLDPRDYQLAAIEALRPTAGSSPKDTADLDLLLTDATIPLAYHLRFRKGDPEELDSNWNLARNLAGVDPATVLQDALDKGKLFDTLAALEPTYPFYTNLKKALADYRHIAAQGGWPTIPAGAKLQPGASDARVPLLRRRLAITGDLPEAAAADESTT